jgi:hypothetical protein
VISKAEEILILLEFRELLELKFISQLISYNFKVPCILFSKSCFRFNASFHQVTTNAQDSRLETQKSINWKSSKSSLWAFLVSSV